MCTQIARRYEDVISVLEFAEREARSGSHVAVLLSYEAAPAFDSAFVTHPPSDFPLAWASVLDDACDGDHFAPASSTDWTPLVARDEYDRSVSRIKELIADGDTYQVNYTFPLISSFNGDARAWYRDLCIAQGAEYSVYLDLGRFKVLCLSPELFFERRGNHVITRPMKGTVRRGRWPAEDRELASHSASSRSSAGQRPRRTVPFIGRVMT